MGRLSLTPALWPLFLCINCLDNWRIPELRNLDKGVCSLLAPPRLLGQLDRTGSDLALVVELEGDLLGVVESSLPASSPRVLNSFNVMTKGQYDQVLRLNSQDLCLNSIDLCLNSFKTIWGPGHRRCFSGAKVQVRSIELEPFKELR